MYNRYIPQPDGSYRKNPMREATKEAEPIHSPTPPPPPPQNSAPPPGNCHTCPNRQPQRPPVPSRPRPPAPKSGISGFLKQLLPKDFDTEDLLVILLLLLMAGDCQEDQNSALLTLALYLFL